MNYYERHLGDFAKDTAHLSALEVGIYDLLMDRYYASERPIPQSDVNRIARARSKDEIAAVVFVLAEFFSLEDGLYRQKRIDAEIDKYLAKEPTREKAKLDAAERQARARKRRADLFEQLRAYGVTPPMTTQTHVLQTQLDDVISRVMSRVTIESVTRDDTCTTRAIHQSPVPSPHNKTGGTPESGGNTPPPADAGRAQSRTQIDPEFKPDEPNRRVAVSHDLDVESERGRFIAHFTATGDWRANWQAQFRKWILDSMQHRAESAKRQGAPPERRRNRHDERADTIAELTGRNRRHEHESGTIIDITPTTNDVG